MKKVSVVAVIVAVLITAHSNRVGAVRTEGPHTAEVSVWRLKDRTASLVYRSDAFVGDAPRIGERLLYAVGSDFGPKGPYKVVSIERQVHEDGSLHELVVYVKPW